MINRIQDIVSITLAGILALLFFDLRRLRFLKNKDEVTALKKAATEKEFLYKTFLTKPEHNQLCSNTLLRVENSIKDMRQEILKEIKNNRGGKS